LNDNELKEYLFVKIMRFILYSDLDRKIKLSWFSLQDELQLLIVARVIRKKWWVRFKKKSYGWQEKAT